MSTTARQVVADASIGIRVPAKLKATLQAAAADENVTLSHLCSRILSDAMHAEEAAA